MKILLYDIETTPVRANIWHTGKQYISHENVVAGDYTKIICIAYKWQHEKTVHCLQWDKKKNCKRLIEEFSKIIESADLAIAHNGDRFDVKHLNTQRLIHGLPPIAWPTTEDTLKQIKQIFYLPSYRLDYVSKLLLGEGKDSMTYQDWLDIRDLPVRSETYKQKLKKMVTYCKRDVMLMSKSYEKLTPFLKKKVSRATLTNGDCPSCGSSVVQKHGKRPVGKILYYRMRCNTCGHVFRGARV